MRQPFCDESGVRFATRLAENSTLLWSHHSILRSDETWLPEWLHKATKEIPRSISTHLYWRSLLFFSFNSGEQAFQTIKPRLFRLVFGIQNLAQVFNAVGNVADGFGQPEETLSGILRQCLLNRPYRQE